MANYIPRRSSILAVTTDQFLAQVRESEYVREYEARLELNALTLSDPIYHPIGS